MRLFLGAALRTLVALLCSACLVPAWSADAPTEPAESGGPVSYYRQVRPILQAHCQGCHQPAKASGQYVMTEFARLLEGGESGMAAVVPGNVEESFLVTQITPVDGFAEMPQNKPPLEPAQVELIARWIHEGAKDDTPASAKQTFDAEHPPVYSAPPVITAVRISPDGATAAVSGYHEVMLMPVEKLLAGQVEVAARLVGMSERIEAVAFSPDGTLLAVAGGSPARFGEIQIWNLADASLQLSLPVGYDTCYGVSWSPDGKLVAYGCPDHTIHAVEVATGEEVFYNRAHNDWVMDTVFSTDQSHLVSVSRDRSMKLYEVASQRFIDNITSITPGALKGGLSAVDRHPERDELVIGGADGVAKIYRMFREKDRKIGDDFNLVRALPEMPGRVFDVGYSRDGSLVVAGSSAAGSGEVRVFRTDSGEQVSRAKEVDSPIFTVDLSPDGKYFVAGGLDGYLYLGAVETGERIARVMPVRIESPGGLTATAP